MKKVPLSQYAKALYEASEGLSWSKLQKVIKGFVEILARDQKLKRADEIIDEFLKYAKKREGIRQIEILSARELKKAGVEAIKNAFGKKVEAVQKVDAQILGGVIVRAEDVIIDASLKTQLIKLKQNLEYVNQ